MSRPPPPARPRAREVAGSGEGRYLHLPLLSVRNSEGHRGLPARGLGREGGSEIGHAGGVRHARRALDLDAVGFTVFKRFFSGTTFVLLPFCLPWSCPWERVDYLLRISRVLGNIPVTLLTSVPPGPDANC